MAMVDGTPVRCARCECALEPKPNDYLACPKCGEIATDREVMDEVGKYLYDQGLLGPSLKKKPRQKREHRFIV